MHKKREMILKCSNDIINDKKKTKSKTFLDFFENFRGNDTLKK